MGVEVPETWPKEVSTYYDPVRVLGRGGFGSVVLGRLRSDAPTTFTTTNDHCMGKPVKPADFPFVAIKVVGSKDVTPADIGYAHREMDILQELAHPCIIKLLHYWELDKAHHKCAAVMVLTYAKGPTLHDLVRKGGALSLHFGRVVLAQVMDALAYLHSRAVVHRDIKVDNVIITGATGQDEIWDDLQEEQQRQRKTESNLGDQDWGVWRKKYRVTLIDFGFARALTPEDMGKKPSRPNPELAASTTLLSDRSSGSRGNNSLGNSSRSSIRRSYSRTFRRQMSAVGNRLYAAPEITHDIHVREPSIRDGRDIMHTISDHVAYYGLQVDAYSMGVLMRVALTGVPPEKDVQETIALENHPLLQLGRLLCCSSGNKKKNTKSGNGEDQKKQRTVQYRGWDAMPAEVFRLIKGMTQYDPQQRTSIRMARRYPWIDDVLESDGPEPKQIDYLKLVRANENVPTKGNGQGGKVVECHEA